MTNIECLTDRTNDMNRFVLWENNRSKFDFFMFFFYFFVSFENITTKCIARIVTSDETKDLKILTIVWNVENARENVEKSKDKINFEWFPTDRSDFAWE